MPQKNHSLQAVIFKRGGWWIGQCLQHDIGAEARTPKQVGYELERAIVAHIAVALENGVEPFNGLAEAPRRYWKMFDEGAPMQAQTPIEFVVHGRREKAPAPEVRVSDLVAEPA
jgi:hypothetical protein